MNQPLEGFSCKPGVQCSFKTPLEKCQCMQLLAPITFFSYIRNTDHWHPPRLVEFLLVVSLSTRAKGSQSRLAQEGAHTQTLMTYILLTSQPFCNFRQSHVSLIFQASAKLFEQRVIALYSCLQS